MFENKNNKFILLKLYKFGEHRIPDSNKNDDNKQFFKYLRKNNIVKIKSKKAFFLESARNKIENIFNHHYKNY